MNSLSSLRETLSFELRSEIVRALCSSINGDILHALWERNRRLDEGKLGCDIEENALIQGIYDALIQMLKLRPYKLTGDRFSIDKNSAKEYTFEEYPESLDDAAVQRFSVETLRPGWKVEGRTVVKPVVFEVISTSELIEAHSGSNQKSLREANAT